MNEEQESLEDQRRTEKRRVLITAFLIIIGGWLFQKPEGERDSVSVLIAVAEAGCAALCAYFMYVLISRRKPGISRILIALLTGIPIGYLLALGVIVWLR